MATHLCYGSLFHWHSGILGVVNGEIRESPRHEDPSPRLLGKMFRDSTKLITNHAKMKKKKIFQDPRFLMYHSPTLILEGQVWVCGEYSDTKQEQGIMPYAFHFA